MAAKRHRLAQRRKTVSFTQETLAEQLGVDSTTVRRWETGETETGPQPWLRPKLARCLQVSLERLEELLSEATPADTASRAPEVDEQHVAAALADARRYFDGPVVDYFRHQLDAALYAQVLAGDGLSRRDRGYFLARRASSLVLAGEPDEAAGTGLEATQLASLTTSQRTKQELLRVLEALKPWRNRPGPRDLREALLTFEATVTNPS